jgi:hypothetical protein
MSPLTLTNGRTLSFGYHYCSVSGTTVLNLPAVAHQNRRVSGRETEESDINDKATCRKSRKCQTYIRNHIKIYESHDK